MEAIPKRRVGKEQSDASMSILDAAERLMIEEGYAAVTVRRLAAQAGVKPAMVQYYFPTMDDLFLAAYRRGADRSIERQAAALADDQPLEALWALGNDTGQTVLAVEFMALANHRKTIRSEITAYNERARAMQADVLAGVLARAGVDLALFAPAGVSQLLAGAARGIVMEHGLGISGGHDAARDIVARLLEQLRPVRRD